MNAIVDEARRWVKTPFQHQGRLIGVGVDCIGLVLGVGRALGILDAPEEPYRIPSRPEHLRNWLDAHMERSLLRKPGDVLLVRHGTRATHCAIYCGHNPRTRTHTMIHALGRGCREHSINADWARRIVAAYRYPNG